MEISFCDAHHTYLVCISGHANDFFVFDLS